jgi:hypothetical protein
MKKEPPTGRVAGAIKKAKGVIDTLALLMLQ